MKDLNQFCNVYLKLEFISFKLIPIETSLWHHNRQHATSREVSKGTIVVKLFLCLFIRTEDICTM